MTTKDRTESTNSAEDDAEHKVRTGYFIEYKRKKKTEDKSVMRNNICVSYIVCMRKI